MFLDGPGPPSWLVTFTGNDTALWPVTDATADDDFSPTTR